MLTTRRRFLRTALTTSLTVVALPLLSQCGGVTHRDVNENTGSEDLQRLIGKEGIEILRLAALAPNGHNTQPWRVTILEPQRWRIATDPARWLPAVDPSNREMLLSMGAFLENLTIAAAGFGYTAEIAVLADSPRAETIAEVVLRKTDPQDVPLERIIRRRTIRKGLLSKELTTEDVRFIAAGDSEQVHYVPLNSPQGKYLAEATLEANRIQANRHDAQVELADWVRWSDEAVQAHRDGLTPATMEITGIAGWYVRMFYKREDVLKQSFREATLKMVTEQVRTNGGWLIITGDHGTPVDAVTTASPILNIPMLLETGRRFQRLFLKVRERGIALHPMTQILEEQASLQDAAAQPGLPSNIQFIVRTGYVKSYPDPVSVRRPVAWFTQIG